MKRNGPCSKNAVFLKIFICNLYQHFFHRTIPNAGRYFAPQLARPLYDKRPLHDTQADTVYVGFIAEKVTEEILYELFLNVSTLIQWRLENCMCLDFG